jgi:hypothetical protein
MKCGHCKGKHDTVAEVKLCAGAFIPQVKPHTSVALKDKVTLTEPGMYMSAGVVYRVERSTRHADRLYAKRLVPVYFGAELHKIEFTYDRGAVYRLEPGDRMTLEQVASLGKITGRCWVCRHKLTVAKSIAAGIGPVCAKKV